jgi:pimeloyl-ACP methyl ester carboxylesterase
MPRTALAPAALLLSAVLWLAAAARTLARDDSEQILTIDHFVSHVSTAPAIAGQPVQLYVREKVQAGAALRNQIGAGKVVLLVHGLTYPSTPNFDVQYQDYSWMAYLARAGFDVFAMDVTGYGQSTRPEPMNDPCNANPEQQALLTPAPLPETCPPTHTSALTTYQSDWADMDAVVDYLRAIRHVDRVSLIGWSLGGPRAGGYAALHPEKVEKLLLLAPAYDRQAPSTLPADAPEPGYAFALGWRERAFNERWDSQVQCENQFDPAIRDVIWSMNMEYDTVGATWGPGVVRTPTRELHPLGWGWNAELAAKVQAPTLVVVGDLEGEVPPQAVRELHTDLGSQHKVLLEMACSSHYIPWEASHNLLFEASADWLLNGSLSGAVEGTFRRGD